MASQGPVPPQPPGFPQSPMPPQGPTPRPRRLYMGPIILIAIGVFFLVANLMPSFDPWQALYRYWPVILILVGLGKVWDYYTVARSPYERHGSDFIVPIVLVLLLVLLIAGMHRGWRGLSRSSGITRTETQSVELQNATAVTANLQLGAGQLNLSGGSGKLLDASFDHDESMQAPQVSYSVDAGHGLLNIDEGRRDQIHLRDNGERWDLHFNSAVPLDLNLNIGAGQSELHMADVNLSRMQVHMGVGQMELDLTGARKQDFSVEVNGGVGQGRITLPKDVGVRAHVSGGIGSINTDGLTRQGDEYVNAAYGKTPATIDLTVHGGIGEIDLDEQ